MSCKRASKRIWKSLEEEKRMEKWGKYITSQK